ncbi:MAG: amino acid permease [Aggregatilineales bacterium]
MVATSQKISGENSSARFGTFSGVFTPNILTILGIILFLRLGEVAGNGGLWNALAIVLLANAISLLTGFSLSAVATNMTVRAGGNYYIISRSLGLEIGGAIGIPLFLSQAISVAFYIIGFTEALNSIEFFQQFDARLISSLVTLVFIFIAYIGADFALKIQYIILAILAVSLASFFIGAVGAFGQVEPLLTPNFQPDNNFWIMFALFFPAVTGIEVGTSLSGDLKNPSFSIPFGTIASIIFTMVIYILVVVLLIFTVPVDALLNDNLSMQRVAIIPELILAGVWASTLSSALGSILSAPRTLQAIANDRVIPHWLSNQMGSKTEPRLAVIITGIIALIVIWVGDLNAVAPIIAMFFLNTYGMVNLTAGIEKLVGNPSYRPLFKVPWQLSLLGALGCYSAMVLINPIATVIAIVISYGFFFSLQQRQMIRAWGDVRSGIWFALARWALINLEDQEWSVKNWRPNIIVFTGQPHNRQQLVEVAKWLSLGRGIVTFFQLIVGDTHELAGKPLREKARGRIKEYIREQNMYAFAEVEIVPSFPAGALMLVQAHGIGGIVANSVLMGWSRTPEGRNQQMKLMLDFTQLKKSVLFLAYNDEKGFGDKSLIHVWWQGRGGNEDLMLLLVYFIAQHASWRDTTLKLLRVIDNEEGIADTKAHMESILKDVRMDAQAVVLVREPDMPFADVIKQHSDASLTVLGMAIPQDDQLEAYSIRLNSLVSGVGTVLLVRNAQEEHDILTAEGA